MSKMFFGKNHLFIGGFLCLLLAMNFLNVRPANAEEMNIPEILPRSAWDNSEELHNMLSWIPDRKNISPPDYAKIDRIVIHDSGCPISSASCNSDTFDPVLTIQSIYRSHTIFRGWGDIGYNYIIDRKGNIYEGRFGGNGVRGAHTYYDRKCMNFNVGTAGIVLLGNYSTQAIPEPMYQSLEKLAAWIGANNNIDPTDMTRTAPVWYNPKKTDGKCDNTSGSFGTAFTAPALVSHKDVEAGNPDPGTLDLARVRRDSKPYYDAYRKDVYRVPGTNPFWIIENGERISFAAEKSLIDAGYAGYASKNLSASQLEFYPLHSSYTYPDGTLIKAQDAPAVYLLDGGHKRLLDVTSAEFERLGFKWDQIVTIIGKDLADYPDGPPVKFASPEGMLISEPGDKIYKIENGRKRWVTSLMLFLALGYKWDNVQKISADESNRYLDGSWMIYPDGLLIKGSDGKVYRIASGERHLATSLQLFNKLKLKWDDVKSIMDSEVDIIKEGNPLVYPDGSLVKAKNDAKIYSVKDGKKHLIGSSYLFKKLGYNAKNVLAVDSEEIAALPDSEPVRYPSGTLLKAASGSEIFAVEKGALRWIKTLEEFKKKKYRWQDVVGVAAEELATYSIAGFIPPSFALQPTPTPIPSPAPAVSSSPVVPKSMPLMRVAIYSPAAGDKIQISANGEYYAKSYNGKNELIGSVKKTKGEITTIDYFTEGYWRLEGAGNGVIIKALSYSDVPSWDKTLNDNEFKGLLEVRYSPVSGKLWVINEVSLEDYVEGVSEASNGDSLEYLKTFAVAVRTYGKFYIDRGGKYAEEPFYLKNSRLGNGNDQIYRGYGFAKRANNIVAADSATRGEIAVYKSKPIVAAYSSDSGGITKDGCTVLSQAYCNNDDYAYLRGGVKDPAATVHDKAAVAASHGAGLSAAGARQMAKEGKAYKEIIAYYYPGAQVEKIY